MLRPRFELAKPEDIQIPRCVENAAEAVAVIREHRALVDCAGQELLMRRSAPSGGRWGEARSRLAIEIIHRWDKIKNTP